jgi:hypothetical protein
VKTKARNGIKNGRWKGIPLNLEVMIITGFLIGLSPYILSCRIKISHKIMISPNRIRNFLKYKGINWRDWKKNGEKNK